jgi:GT2 family glycosyltransferase
MFSIIIPSWNNLPFLKLCIQSIRKHSAFSHQILVHANEGSDGTREWLRAEGIEHTASDENIGVCKSVNLVSTLAKEDYIVFLNDDMYVLPGWDTALLNEAKGLETDKFMLSGTMIEPEDHHNPAVILADFGSTPEAFRESELLEKYRSFPKEDWSGSKWPPAMVHRKYWQLVGGYSIEFSPGMSSDDDFAMKMWLAGCRIFKGVAASRVYHFVSKSTSRVKKNNGRAMFNLKYGMNQSAFKRFYLQLGEPFLGPLPEPKAIALRWDVIRSRIKRIFY